MDLDCSCRYWAPSYCWRPTACSRKTLLEQSLSSLFCTRGLAVGDTPHEKTVWLIVVASRPRYTPNAMELMPLASSLGLGMLAGARLYATVLAVGLMLRFHWIALPGMSEHVSVLTDTRILVASGAACAIEFLADKIPWVDSMWDAVHTFIRPIGAALLTSSLFSNVDPAYQVLLFLLAGGVALSGHSAKAAARLAVNHSPEPFSNIVLSLLEDAFVAGGVFLFAKYPWVLAGIALAFLVLFAWFAPPIYRALRAECVAFDALLRSWFGEALTPELTNAQRQWMQQQWSGNRSCEVFAVIATRDLKSLRNVTGTLCLADREAVFFSRRWGRLATQRVEDILAVRVDPGLLEDRLVLTMAGGHKIGFDLLAGQLERARQSAQRTREVLS